MKREVYQKAKELIRQGNHNEAISLFFKWVSVASPDANFVRDFLKKAIENDKKGDPSDLAVAYDYYLCVPTSVQHITMTQFLWLLYYLIREEKDKAENMCGQINPFNYYRYIEKFSECINNQLNYNYSENVIFLTQRIVAHCTIKLPKDKTIAFWSKIEPNWFSDELETYITEDGQSITVASKREQVAFSKAKVMRSIEEYKKCIEICDNSLKMLKSCQWEPYFINIKVGCLVAQGQYQDAISMLNAAIAVKPEWHFYQTKSQIYLLLENYEQSILSAFIALFKCNSDAKYYLQSIKSSAEAAAAIGAYGVENLGFSLYKHIKVSNGWEIREDESPESKIELQPIRTDTFKDSLEDYINQLKEYIVIQKNLLFHGTVTKLWIDIKAGCIRADNGSDYFFQMSSCYGGTKGIMEGRDVFFVGRIGFNTKNSRHTWVADVIFQIPKQVIENRIEYKADVSWSTQVVGIVAYVNYENNFGFIYDADGERYYFKIGEANVPIYQDEFYHFQLKTNWKGKVATMLKLASIDKNSVVASKLLDVAHKSRAAHSKERRAFETGMAEDDSMYGLMPILAQIRDEHTSLNVHAKWKHND